MVILHISFTKINRLSGINEVLINLTHSQNLLKNISSHALFISDNVTNFTDPCFYFESKLKSIKKTILRLNPEYVIFHGFYNFKYSLIASFLLLKKIPYLIQPHSSFDKNSQIHSFFRKKIANLLILNKFRKNALSIIFLNEKEKENSYFPVDRYLIIPNGVKLRNLPFSLNSQKSTINLFYIGRIDIFHKGLDIMINFFNNISSKIKLVLNIYGTGEKKELIKLIRKIRYSNNIFFHGAVFGKEKEKAFLDNDVFLLTSRYEGLPISILESLSYGKPLLITEGTNMTYLFKEFNVGKQIFDIDSDLSEIVSFLFDFSKNKEKYFIECIKCVSKNFTWDQIASLSIEKIRNIGSINV